MLFRAVILAKARIYNRSVILEAYRADRIHASLLFPPVVFRGFENLVGIGDAFCSGRERVLQRIINAEFLVLAECECVVGEDFDALDVAECADEVAGTHECFVVVAAAGDEHVADPDGLVDAVEVAEKVNDVLVTVACEVLVCIFIDVLDIDEQKVCRFHKSLDFCECFAGASKRNSACIDACVDSGGFCGLEELYHEVYLR